MEKFDYVKIAVEWWASKIQDRYENLRYTDVYNFIRLSDQITEENIKKFKKILSKRLYVKFGIFGRKTKSQQELICLQKPAGELSSALMDAGMSGLLELNCTVVPAAYMIINPNEVKLLDVHANEMVLATKDGFRRQKKQKERNL